MPSKAIKVIGLIVIIVLTVISTNLIPTSTEAKGSPALHITPASILQGDPVMITLPGAADMPLSSPPLYFFLYKNVPTALYGTDLNQKTGTTTISVTLANGTKLSGSFVIMPRIKQQESLPIPTQIGGNSVANQTAVVSELTTENAELAAVHSRTDKALWTGTFAFPVSAPIVITDPYGYERDSGAASISHKGADFRAPPGTPVYAINRGVVRVAKTFSVYGNTVIIDHGLGLLSMYMHLSKIDVVSGQLVQKGQLIGLSGETGYAEGPHLHLTIRINGISVDPIAFFTLFGVNIQ